MCCAGLDESLATELDEQLKRGAGWLPASGTPGGWLLLRAGVPLAAPEVRLGSPARRPAR